MSNLLYLAQTYFFQDFEEDDAEEAIEVVEKFRDSESAERVEGLRAEVMMLLDSDETEEDLTRIWVDDANSYYEPAHDDLTMRQWLQQIVDVLDRKTDAPVPAADAGAAEPPTDPSAGIPFKGTSAV